MAEVIAISALLWKAAEFLPQIRDGLYKGSVEVDEFRIKVAILRAKHAQWTSLLQKFGMTEDEHLKPLVKEAVQILDKEQDYVTKLQKSRFMRLRRRAFPGKLTYILSSLVDILDASPQLLEKRVEINDLLVRSLVQNPCPLRFGPDRKYVPLLGSITEVQKALEDADGSCVVTLHGGPGMGKSSMVKYLALHYQQLRRQQMVSGAPSTLYFPDGVFYLFCGRRAQATVKQLQVNLLEGLGAGFGFSTQLKGGTGDPEEEGQSVHLPSHDTKLRFCLAEKRSLIILDDVWEVDLLEKLLVPGASVKYLVTSQIRTICSDATMIELKSPNIEEARKILANYTEGLPIKGELPASIQSVTDAIIQKLEYHPLSLANIGTVINRRSATDPREWEALKDGLQDHLDENDFHTSQLVYGTTYPLTVGASMTLMVDSLHPDAKHLLFLMGLLTFSEIPEVLVKFFLKQIQPATWKNRYRRDIKYLEDRSLVEYRCHSAYDGVADEEHTSRPVLVTHGLRIYYIRNKHSVDVTGIATEIFSGGSRSWNDHGGQLVPSGCTDEALAPIMGAMYFEKPFRDVVATKLESQSRIFNAAVIPQSMNYDVDALDLMDRAGCLKQGLESLVWLLNPDGEGGWKQQAHEYAKKIMIRLTFRCELDDESMAGLIQLPHTTTAACQVLRSIICWSLADALEDACVDQNITFSSAHGQTMRSLNDMCSLHHNVEATNRCAAAVAVLGHVLRYESDDTILSIAKKWVEFLAKDSIPTLQTAVARAISKDQIMRLSRAKKIVGEFPGILDHLLMLIVEESDSHLRWEAVEAICRLCESSTVASKIAAIPGALEILFKMFLSLRDQQYYRYGCQVAGDILCRLSCRSENRVRFTTVHGGLAGLTKMLTSSGNLRLIHIAYPVIAARILANLATTSEVRKTILAAFPEVKEGLRLLRVQVSNFSRIYGPYQSWDIRNVSIAMTILDPLQGSPNITSSPVPPRACYEAYMGRVHAYQEMQMYSEALEALNVAHDYYEQMPLQTLNMGHDYYRQEPLKNKSKRDMLQLSQFRIFFKAMLEDYAGAMVDANTAIENFPYRNDWDYKMLLASRGVLKQLVGVDLAGALVDLDEALQLMPGHIISERYGCLKHRGLVKQMMGDQVGARADAESALQLNFRWLASEEIYDAWTMGPTARYSMLKLPVNYLGFSL